MTAKSGKHRVVLTPGAFARRFPALRQPLDPKDLEAALYHPEDGSWICLCCGEPVTIDQSAGGEACYVCVHMLSPAHPLYRSLRQDRIPGSMRAHMEGDFCDFEFKIHQSCEMKTFLPGHPDAW